MKKTAYRLFKKPFFGRFQKPWRWPDNIDRSQWHRLSFPSGSGATLSGLLGLSYVSPAKGAVVCAHPMGVSAKGFWLRYGHAELLRKAGYHVMVFDLNGFGESESTNMEFPLDVLAAGQVLQKEFPELPTAVLGASMGGSFAICSMAQPDHPFKAAVIESAFPTLLQFWGRYPIPKIGVQLSQWVYPAGERRLRPVHAAGHVTGSPDVLLIYGEEDEFTTIKDGQQLEMALLNRTRTEFWRVDGAKHTHAYTAQPEEYTLRVLRFLDRTLAGQTADRLNQ